MGSQSCLIRGSGCDNEPRGDRWVIRHEQDVEGGSAPLWPELDLFLFLWKSALGMPYLMLPNGVGALRAS